MLTFNPLEIISDLPTIKGYNEFKKAMNIANNIVFDTAEAVIDQWVGEWEDGQGFGSSDYTFMLQDVVDRLIETTRGYESGWKTGFPNGCLECYQTNMEKVES